MDDYCAGWPLWIDDVTEVSDWEFSQPFMRRLTAWATFFDEHFDREHGWDSAAACRQHRAEGVRLHRVLVTELGPGYSVILEPWETKNC